MCVHAVIYLRLILNESLLRFDRTLGGFEMELRLREHLAKLFNEQKKSKKDVRENMRAMAKLLKEAQRLKTVLSANAEHTAQVGPLTSTFTYSYLEAKRCLGLMKLDYEIELI